MTGVLALDQATVTGWAHSEPGQTPTWGHIDLAKSGVGMGKVGAAFSIFLEARIAVFRPQFVIYETPFIGGGRIPINPLTLRRLLGIAGLIDTICEQRGIECREAGSLAFTKFFTGQGRFEDRQAKKRATMERCKMLGWECSEDEADAVALLLYAEAKLFPRYAMARPAGPLFSPERAA